MVQMAIITITIKVFKYDHLNYQVEILDYYINYINYFMYYQNLFYLI
jgi:hypothetical protein